MTDKSFKSLNRQMTFWFTLLVIVLLATFAIQILNIIDPKPHQIQRMQNKAAP